MREELRNGSQGPYFRHKECGFRSSAKYELPRYNAFLNCKPSASSTLFHVSVVLNTMQTCSLLENRGNTTELLTVLKIYQNYIACVFCYKAVNDSVRLKMNEPSLLCKPKFVTESAVVFPPPWLKKHYLSKRFLLITPVYNHAQLSIRALQCFSQGHWWGRMLGSEIGWPVKFLCVEGTSYISFIWLSLVSTQ